MAAFVLAQGAGSAEAAGWSRFEQGELKGALFTNEGGAAAFLLACDAPGDALLQVALPDGAKAKAGSTAKLSLAVDGRRFRYSGKVMDAEDGASQVMMTAAKADDPLVKALAGGSDLKVSLGRASYAVPLDGAADAVAAFVAACGGKAPAADAPREARADAGEAKPAPAAARASGGGVPPAREIAAAIFVDKAEGERVAGALKVMPIDLNGDGQEEAIVTVKDGAWCGENGCTLFVVSFAEGKPRIIGEFIGSSLTPTSSRTDGWRDLTLNAPGGSERESFVDGGYR